MESADTMATPPWVRLTAHFRVHGNYGMMRTMHLSIIVPAFNEARLIEQCIQSITLSVASHSKSGFTSEIIVVNNNSTDNTAELAKLAGAQVVFEPINQIGRARNAGAAQATGDWLLFLDADSLLSPGLLADILQMIESGRYVGCGSTLRMDAMPWWANLTLQLWTRTSILCRWAAGALVVCRRDAFHEVGGFDQDLYALDEIRLSKLLKQWGRERGLQFSILTNHPLETSSRKFSLYSSHEIAGQIFRIFLLPKQTLQDKKHLSFWYDGRR
jgi:glycosyltransferase involved in cell wall biosynthesis